MASLNTLFKTNFQDAGSKSHFKSIGIFDDDRFDVNSFCRLIHNALPRAVKDGKFILIEPEMDQSALGDTPNSVAVPPPAGFAIPRLLPRLRLRIPKIKVPKLRSMSRGPSAPRLRSSVVVPRYKDSVEEDSSAERMKRFKKGVQKLLRVVKVLGQVDQYLSERTRIVVEKLSKTFAD